MGPGPVQPEGEARRGSPGRGGGVGLAGRHRLRKNVLPQSGLFQWV